MVTVVMVIVVRVIGDSGDGDSSEGDSSDGDSTIDGVYYLGLAASFPPSNLVIVPTAVVSSHCCCQHSPEPVCMVIIRDCCRGVAMTSSVAMTTTYLSMMIGRSFSHDPASWATFSSLLSFLLKHVKSPCAVQVV